MENWEVDIRTDFLRADDLLYITRYSNGRREFLTHGGREVKTLQEGELASDDELCFARIPRGVLRSVVTAATDAGVKPEKQSFIEGKLDASLNHLEDMRKLVFKETV